MADPKQLRIMQALTAHLAGINPANIDPATDEPYVYDLSGDRVARGRTDFGDEMGEGEFLALLESPQPVNGAPAAQGGVKRAENWTILLQGFAKDDKRHPTDPAYRLKAAVEMRLARLIQEAPMTGLPVFPDEHLLGKLISALIIGQGVVRPPDKQVSTRAFFYIPLVVSLSTDVTNPYAD